LERSDLHTHSYSESDQNGNEEGRWFVEEWEVVGGEKVGGEKVYR
jgi:hypothetical protein